MAPPPVDIEANQLQERDAFVSQLPKRIAAIEDIWAKLTGTAWDAAQLEALYDRVREISEYSKSYSLFQLNESVFSLEVYLSSFVGSDISPGSTQIDAISGLVRALKTAANMTTTASHDHEPPAGELAVFVLGSKGSLTAELTSALRDHGCNVQHFRDTASLLQALQEHAPRVIVADTAMLPEMPPLSAELVRLRSHMSINIPLIFVSK